MMKRTDIHVRLPEDLAASLQAESKQTGISVNSMIIACIAQAWNWPHDATPPSKKGKP
jgi:predicted HicB family RNase H-like nuclease